MKTETGCRVKDKQLLETIRQTLLDDCRVPTGVRILVAVSGGPDSTALLEILNRLAPSHRWELAVCHLNHGWRDASDRDETHVAEQARRLNLPFFSETIETGPRETPARRVRYDFFERTAREWNAPIVATGHQADDRVETVLQRLIRGTGPLGLAGIPFQRPIRPDDDSVRLVRPLLNVTADRLVSFLTEASIPWVVDASNRSPKPLRNRIRHELLPELRTLNPRVDAALRRLASHATEWRTWIHAERDRALSEMTFESERAILSLEQARRLPPPVLPALLQAISRRYGVRPPDASHLESFKAMLEPNGPAGCPFPGNRIWRRSQGRCTFEEAPPRQ